MAIRTIYDGKSMDAHKYHSLVIGLKSVGGDILFREGEVHDDVRTDRFKIRMSDTIYWKGVYEIGLVARWNKARGNVRIKVIGGECDVSRFEQVFGGYLEGEAERERNQMKGFREAMLASERV